MALDRAYLDAQRHPYLDHFRIARYSLKNIEAASLTVPASECVECFGDLALVIGLITFDLRIVDNSDVDAK